MMTIMHFRGETAEGETIELNYTVEGWQVPDNPDYPIDDSLVEDVIQPLCAVKSDRLLTEDPSAMAEYGLSPARFHVELTDSSGNVIDPPEDLDEEDADDDAQGPGNHTTAAKTAEAQTKSSNTEATAKTTEAQTAHAVENGPGGSATTNNSSSGGPGASDEAQGPGAN